MNKIGVIGLGQIGASIARASLACKIAVVGVDTNPLACAFARDEGVRIVQDIETMVEHVEVIFCCVGLSQNLGVLRRLLAASATMSNPPTVSDVSSYKQGAVPTEGNLANLIPGHPMAGGHGVGFLSSTPTLFDRSIWNLIVSESTSIVRLVPLIQLINQLGARVHLCSQSWHDKTVSLVSGLPHLLAITLGLVADRQDRAADRVKLAAGSFRDATRVVQSDAGFVRDLILHNRSTLKPLILETIATLNELGAAIENNDCDAIYRQVGIAAGIRKQMAAAELQPETKSLSQSVFFDFLMDIRDSGRSIVSVNAQNGVYHCLIS